MSIKQIKYFSLGYAFVAYMALPMLAHAATLSLSPSSGSISVGDTITLAVLVNSTDVAINNAEGSVTFPANEFDVVSVNKDNSLFSLWINAPTYDGNNSISFNGGLPSPGYQGSSGTLFTLTLRAKAEGSAALSISNAAVRANDGLGTNVLSDTSGANITIADAVSAPISNQPAPTSAPIAVATNSVVVSSPTDPSPDMWYNRTDALLQFALPDGATSVETTLSKYSDTLPTVVYKPVITEKSVTGIPDGTWYFNVRARVAGAWTDTTSYALHIDTVPPAGTAAFSFDVNHQALIVSATSFDALSGVASYVVFVDGATTTTLTADHILNSVAIPLHEAPGDHAVILRVLDRAGNYTDVSGNVTVVMKKYITGEVLKWIQSPTGIDVLIGVLALLLLLLIATNIGLWLKLTAHKRPGGKDIIVVKTAAKKNMLDFKKSVGIEDKKLEKIYTHKKLTPAETESLKKIRTALF